MLRQPVRHKEATQMTNIERHTIPAITVASLRKKVADYHEEGNL